jgi:site-specific DNA-methyltransferase (adenine-specific)
MQFRNQIIQGEALSVLKTMPNECVDMCLTSPPYWRLRDYGVLGQLGREETLEKYIGSLCDIFDEVKRILKPYGTCWVNLGDTHQNKSLLNIPSRFAIEMTNRNWLLRNEIIWHKTNAIPSSARDRFNPDFEKVFFFTKNRKYYFCTQYEPLAPSTYKRMQYGLNGERSKLDAGVHAMTVKSWRDSYQKLANAPGTLAPRSFAA